ncbi:MAG: DUF2911 domain-containing protein [Chitinophagaceae bacterium]
MKYCLSTALALVISILAISQTKLPPQDQSPMDMSYYPVNYPILKIQDKITEPLIARVAYSRPQRNGRGVFGELVEYEKVWRLGANEATEIEFFKNVYFAGKPVPKGRYTLCAIPYLDKWIVIINTETDTWGSFKYDSKKDIVRVEVPVQKINETAEILSIFFDKTPAGFNLCAEWENTGVTIPLTLNVKPPIKTPVKVIKKT